VFGGLRGCLRSVARVVFGEFVVRFARFRLRESSRIVSEVSAAACVNIMGKFCRLLSSAVPACSESLAT